MIYFGDYVCISRFDRSSYLFINSDFDDVPIVA